MFGVGYRAGLSGGLTLIKIRAWLRLAFERLRLAWRTSRPGPLLGRIDPGQIRTITSGVELPADGDVVYAPPLATDRLDADAIRGALLCLSHLDYDFLLYSRALLDLPTVRVPERWLQSVVFRRRACGHFLDGLIPSEPLRGRVVRTPGLSGHASDISVERLFPSLPVRVEGAEIVIGPGRARPASSVAPAESEEQPNPPASRPYVFVWPALWAVGGVERLAIEVMRQLQERYEFVVVTTERLAPGQGSLHHELKALGIATYDLGELGPPEAHLEMLAALKRVYRPMLVWLCNGSPWLCDHAAEIRRAYADTPIVAQLAYDTRAGWITRYREPGIRAFDRHVAINRIIERCLLEEKGLDPEGVDLIYHAYDEVRFDPAAYPPERVRALREAAGFPSDEPLFVFVGRMTSQKRPLDFVHLAESVGDAPPARFLMVGDGDLAPEVDRAAGRVEGDRLKRIPFSDRVSEILAMADGFVITSEYEGLPIAMLEALAMGVPVLATDVGEIRAVVEESGAGMVVDPVGDRQALVRAFRAFRERLPEYRAAAVAAAPSLRQRFGGSTVSNQYEACWKKAVAERRARPKKA